MKIFFLIASTLCLFSVCIPPLAQDAAPLSLYQRCTASIKSTPQDAYEPCSQYFEQMPLDDPSHIECVKKWIATYDKAR